MGHFHRRSAGPDLRKESWKYLVQLLEILLTNNYIWQQTLSPNYRSLHRRDSITRNMWHTAIPNPGTAVRKLTTQEQNQHSCPFHRSWVPDMGEGTCTWCTKLLPNCKLTQFPEIHTHDLTPRNYIYRYHSGQKQTSQKFKPIDIKILRKPTETYQYLD